MDWHRICNGSLLVEDWRLTGVDRPCRGVGLGGGRNHPPPKLVACPYSTLVQRLNAQLSSDW